MYSPLPFGAVAAGVRALWDGSGTPGQDVTELLRAHYGARAILRTDSATSALTLAIRGMLLENPAMAVALPAYSCYDVATAAVGADAPVVFYDLDPETLGPDFSSLREALRAPVAAVVVAHLFGVPVDIDHVSTLAAESGAAVIEDAAQGTGALFDRRPLGSFGPLAVLSFGRGKGLTSGRGGALLASDENGSRTLGTLRGGLLRARRGWRELLELTGQWLLGRPSVYVIPSSLPFLHLGETIYRRPVAPREPSWVSSRALWVTWHQAAAETEIRRRNAERLLGNLGGGLTALRIHHKARPGYLKLPVLASLAVRAAVSSSSARRLGVMTGYPAPLCDLPAVAAHVRNLGGTFPGARTLARRLCTLPTHSRLSEHDLEALENWVASQKAVRH